MKRTIVCGLATSLLLVVVLSAGCAVPEPDAREDVAETTSNLGGNPTCELLSKAAGTGVRVAATAALATGVCAEGAVAATVVSGGLAAPGSAVCLAPATVATVATVTSLLASGLAYLLCGAITTRLEQADATPIKAKPKSPACEGVNAKNISADSADECPPNKVGTPRIDWVFCRLARPGEANYVDKKKVEWFCFDQEKKNAKPHSPCLPDPEIANAATHTHFYEIRYDFSPTKKCCFYEEKETDVKCGSY